MSEWQSTGYDIRHQFRRAQCLLLFVKFSPKISNYCSSQSNDGTAVSTAANNAKNDVAAGGRSRRKRKPSQKAKESTGGKKTNSPPTSTNSPPPSPVSII